MNPVVNRLAGALVLLLISVGVLRATGPLQRVENETLSRLPTAPPIFGYTATNAFPNLALTNPVCITSPPGETNRLFIVEKHGRIVVITNLAAPTRTVFMDITSRVTTGSDTGASGVSDERGLLGLAFHPGYTTNGIFFVFYTGNATTVSTGLHDILARYHVSATDPNQGDASSEVRLIAQRDQYNNHNAGDLHFGPDGYLYVSLGDEGGGDDTGQNSQRIDKDFFSAMMRLDVDKRPGSLAPNPHPSSTTNYAVPPDNPFVNTTSFNGLPVDPNQVRTEFWAVGLRNPWRFSFDPLDGTLYCGNVGQGTRESIDIITKGSNSGWNYWEGFYQRTNSSQIPSGFVLTPPLIDYPRSQGVAVMGGVVYRGQRLSQLYGAYIYGDYGSGRIWALRHDGTNVTENTQLFVDDANSFGAAGVVAFGTDPGNGDVLYADVRNGTNSAIKRIVYNSTQTGASLPTTLADTGAFSDLTTLTPNAGIVPYDINVPFWSDNALKSRWFSVPNTNLTISFSPNANWSFPTGSVWIKHFELELTNGVPSSRKRIETRFIVRNQSGVYGITYRWGDSLTNATLVPEQGMDESLVIDEGSGVLRTQIWHYPSRQECLQCHTGGGGLALGFNTAQMNREYDYDGSVTNQLAALSQAGYFDTPVTNVHALSALAQATNSAVSLEYRVRSYLAANCAQCHEGPGSVQEVPWDARITTPTSQAGIINGSLLQNAGDTNNRVIAPGSLAHSMLLSRISTRGANQMPPLDSTIVDTQAIALVSAWITNDLPKYESFADWQISYFGSTNSVEANAYGDPDGDGARNYLEYLTGTNPTNSLDAWRIAVSAMGDSAHVSFPQIANRGFQVQSATSLANPISWTPVNAPGNMPFFSVSNRVGSVDDTILSQTNKFYRVEVSEP